MTGETGAFVVLMLALIVTRPWEERRWRAGRLSNRASALLVVGRLPFLAVGFAVIVGLDVVAVTVFLAAGLGAAALLYPAVVRRLEAAAVSRRG